MRGDVFGSLKVDGSQGSASPEARGEDEALAWIRWYNQTRCIPRSRTNVSPAEFEQRWAEKQTQAAA